MAFGITGQYKSGGALVEFGGPLADANAKIAGMPDGSVVLIRIYAHGAPGLIGDFDADWFESHLKSKMSQKGQIHLLGCSTAGVEAHPWNPIGGLGLLARTTLYAPMGQGLWLQNLASSVSVKIPNVYVLGLSGISFPLSRVLGSFEPGYRPRALMGDRFVYFNGAHSSLPDGAPGPGQDGASPGRPN